MIFRPPIVVSREKKRNISGTTSSNHGYLIKPPSNDKIAKGLEKYFEELLKKENKLWLTKKPSAIF